MLKLDMNIIWSILNLLILYFLMKKFLFKPVQNIIAQRQAQADEALNDANASKAQAEEARSRYEASVKEVEESKTEIVAQARRTAAAEYEKIVNQANDQAKTIVEDAKTNAEHEKFKIIRSAENDIADMVVNAAGRLAGMGANATGQEKLYDEFLNKAGETLDKD